ncbi:MAG: regulatory protein RecX [Egibacteraceae bacterium]
MITTDTGTATEEVRRALSFVLRSTRARPQTRAELAAKLRAREYDDETIAAALGESYSLGAIDDAAFARAWVEDRGRGRGYATARLRQELRRRQVPDELIEAALGGLDDRDEFDAGLALARQKAVRYPSDLPTEKIASRLVGFLVRRGYAPGLAQRIAVIASGLDRQWD